MNLAVDVGNSNIVIGLFEGEQILAAHRLATDRTATDFQYAMAIKDALAASGVSPEAVRGGIISSVVPSLIPAMSSAMWLLCRFRPLIVGPGIKTGLDVVTDAPAAVGADRIVDAVAARALYGAPVVTVDMGTANTVSVVDSAGRFLGGVIMAGLRLSMEALTRSASLLPQVSLEPPARVIGRNTVESMKSGLILGAAATLDGILDRIDAELSAPCTAVATGGLASTVLPYCRHKLIHEPDLLMKGLVLLYNLNAGASI